MPPSPLTPLQFSLAQLGLAGVLAIWGFYWLLPRPTGRRVGAGVAATLAAAAVFVVWLVETFGGPMPDVVGAVLFWLFASGAVGFGGVLVTQRNPARGAIAFAIVILCVCGLFLLLAAPFLMAATIIVYAGAIIVTFLFVLMLSQTGGPADENDRTREPFFGALAGFAFAGLVLFALHLNQLGGTTAADPPVVARLPAPVLTAEERQMLRDAVARLEAATEQLRTAPTTPQQREATAAGFQAIRDDIARVVGSSEFNTVGSIRERLERPGTRPGEDVRRVRQDSQAVAVWTQAAAVRDANEKAYDAVVNHLLEGQPDTATVLAELRTLRDETVLLSSAADLPARNTANLGYLVYTHHLLAVELAGVLLLVATVGAVAITHRKGVAA